MDESKRINTMYKDTVFRLLFSDKTRLLSLYNAISPKRCDDSKLFEIVTLKNAIYMEVKNDTAFLLGDDIHLWEHQSTHNPNMPLRFLEYIASEYQRLTNKKSIFTRKLVHLPRPHFVVFYNGTEDTADHEQLKLSDAFGGQGDEKLTLELVVDVYNINMGHNVQVLETCETLGGYATFVHRARENQKTMPLDQAVSNAVDDCIRDGILADFFRANKSEVIGVSIFEFDREEHEKQVRAEEYEEGETRGIFKTLYALVKKKLLSLSSAAQEVGQSEEEFAAGMDEYFAQAAAAK